MFVSYLKKAIILFLVLAFLLSIAYFTIPQYCTKAYLLILLFFFIITVGVHFLFLKKIQKKPEKFVRGLMVSNGIKIVSYLAFLILGLAFSSDVVSFLPVFIFLYICFSVFETHSLSRLSKTVSNNKNPK